MDTFNPGQQGHRVPYCRLQVKLKAKSLVELEYKVGLQGAKSPFDFFTITCPPKGLHQLYIVLAADSSSTKTDIGYEQGDKWYTVVIMFVRL